MKGKYHSALGATAQGSWGSAHFLTVAVIGTFAYNVSLNMVYQNFREFTKSNDYCRIHFIYFIVMCTACSWPEVPSTEHTFVLHNEALGSEKEQRVNISGQRNNNLCPSLLHNQAHPWQEIMPTTSYVIEHSFLKHVQTQQSAQAVFVCLVGF